MIKVLLKTAAIGAALYGGYLVYESRFTEQLKYTVIKTTPTEIELREYPSFIVAEVDIQAENARAAANQGFRPLAGYIFGGNTPNQNISMTAPVLTEANHGEKISMTAPVTTQEKSGENISMTAPVTTSQGENANTFTVQFSMPSKWTMETLPKPTDDRVRVVEKPAQLRLVKTLLGEPAQQDINDAQKALEAHAAQKNLVILGDAIWAGYSSPAMPKPLRKWEVMLPVRR